MSGGFQNHLFALYGLPGGLYQSVTPPIPPPPPPRVGPDGGGYTVYKSKKRRKKELEELKKLQAYVESPSIVVELTHEQRETIESALSKMKARQKLEREEEDMVLLVCAFLD